LGSGKKLAAKTIRIKGFEKTVQIRQATTARKFVTKKLKGRRTGGGRRVAKNPPSPRLEVAKQWGARGGSELGAGTKRPENGD